MAGIKERLIQFVLRGKDELSPEAKKSAEALEGVRQEAEVLGKALATAVLHADHHAGVAFATGGFGHAVAHHQAFGGFGNETGGPKVCVQRGGRLCKRGESGHGAME